MLGLWKLMVLLALLVLACTPEEEIITGNEGATLSFSQDTVLFDTLFTDRQSISRFLQIYNPGSRAVQTNIRLSGGNDSPYTIYVNGEKGTNFNEVLLRGQDSLLILVEAFIDPQDENLPFLVEDSLLFTTNGNAQNVKLLSWGQDAYHIKTWLIRQDTVLSPGRPYVITDSIWVQENAKLDIPAGTSLYFEKGGSLWVDGTLEVKGSVEEPVLFTYVRQDGAYANGLGQWQGIFLSEKSSAHQVDYAIVRNAEVGFYINTPDGDTIPDLRISNTIIENMSINGILAVNSDVDAYNLLVNHCVVNAVGNFGKGYYRYVHCTFANDAVTFAREGNTLSFSDTLQADPNLSQVFSLKLLNNIIWGNLKNELFLDMADMSSQLVVNNNLIRVEEEDFSFTKTNIFNEDPLFTDPAIYLYTLDSTSAAIDKGSLIFIKKDILANARDEKPDLGAYEYVKKE